MNSQSSIMVLTTTKPIIFMRPKTRFSTDMKFRRSLEEVLLVLFSDALIIKIKSISQSRSSKTGKSYISKVKLKSKF